MTVTITAATMADFILGMQFFFDRPLVDQTGISAATTSPFATPRRSIDRSQRAARFVYRHPGATWA